MGKTLMLCNCDNTMSLDSKEISNATGLRCSRVHSGLCTQGLDLVAQALPEGDLVIACAQQAPIFAELAEETGAALPECIDIRDRAGWSEQGKQATPKIAALLAEGLLQRPETKVMDVESGGLCLVTGHSDVALPAARQLADILDVTVILTDAPEILPDDLDVLSGRIRKASGTLGNFTLDVDGLRMLEPSGRGMLGFGPARDGGKSECDIILDLSGNTPLFGAPDKRDGYLRADPHDPLAVAKTVFEAAQMLGTFEKPFYVTFEEHLCAHSRAGRPGCNRCLDVCPTGAITTNGDAVSIDPNICAGCSSCAAVCPSGAVSYDAPPVQFLFTRLRTLADAYIAAGGKSARLLVHDEDYGAEIITLAARFGRGLPANVLPLAVPNISGFGHAEILVALASGFGGVDILAAPKTEREALDPQVALAKALVPSIAAENLRIIEPLEPDALCDTLYAAPVSDPLCAPILPLGGRREAARLSAQVLNEAATEPLPLPQGAPYGAVLVNDDACTLCLACASLCPTGALGDNPDLPQLTFREEACLQCGICVGTCPENAISLVPQMDLSANALSQQVLREEEPFSCIECGKPFGVKSTIDRVIQMLEDKHAMFSHSDNVKLIQMCDDCRVRAQYHSDTAPMSGGTRAPTRTTDDYLNDRKPN